MDEMESISQLIDFIEYSRRRDDNGNTLFDAKLYISLNGKFEEKDSQIRIIMGGSPAGIVVLENLDPNDYPVKHYAYNVKYTFVQKDRKSVV